MVHGRLFGERPPLSGEKETLPRQERDRQEISASLAKIKLAVIKFLPFIELNLKKYLIASSDTFAAGCIGHSLRAWKEITSDNEILSTVLGMKIVSDEPPQQPFLAICKRPASEEAVIDLEMEKLLSKRVIEPTGHSHGEIISDVFVRVKKDGGHRMILEGHILFRAHRQIGQEILTIFLEGATLSVHTLTQRPLILSQKVYQPS